MLSVIQVIHPSIHMYVPYRGLRMEVGMVAQTPMYHPSCPTIGVVPHRRKEQPTIVQNPNSQCFALNVTKTMQSLFLFLSVFLSLSLWRLVLAVD
eukprot:gene11290-7824_t